MKTTSRRPRFGDVVMLRGERFTLVATVRVRSLPAASRMEALKWDTRAQRWELAA